MRATQEVVTQGERGLVEPLEVVDQQHAGPDRPGCPMRRLEDANGIERLAGPPRKLAEQLVVGCEVAQQL